MTLFCAVLCCVCDAVLCPTALALDRGGRLLFWIEDELRVRYRRLSAAPPAADVGLVPLPAAARPCALAVYAGRLYYADAETLAVTAVDQLTGQNPHPLRNGSGELSLSVVYACNTAHRTRWRLTLFSLWWRRLCSYD